MQKLFKKLNRSCVAGLAVSALVVGVAAAPNVNQDAARKLPLAFEANRGQTDAQVKFLARAQGYTAFLTADRAVLRMTGTDQAMLAVHFRGANAAAAITGEERQAGVSNYFLAGQKPISGVPQFAKVRYVGVYPGIDVVYSGNNRQLEYDFVIQPGADPRQIRVIFDGASQIAIDSQGDLVLTTVAGTTVNHKPVVYQERNGSLRPVSGEYVILAANEVGFRLGRYDHKRTLVIDPTVNVLTFLGGTMNDEAYGVAVSPQTASATLSGVFLTGRAQSVAFPVTPPTCNAVNSVCQPVPTPATILQVNHAGNSPINYDVVVTKISQDGTTLMWSTFIGGIGDDSGTGIAVDANGNVYVTGYTNPGNILNEGNLFANIMGVTPVVGEQGGYDAFILKMPPNGQSILAATFYGGPNNDQAFAITLDSSAGVTTPNVIIGGVTGGGITPTAPDGVQATFGNSGAPGAGTTDGFAARFDSNLNLLHATYLGGGGNDQVNGVAVDSSGNVYAAGNTQAGVVSGGAFPVANSPAQALGTGGSSAAFVVKLNAAMNSEIYGTLIGQGGSAGATGTNGGAPDTANAIAVDATGRAYVVGSTGDWVNNATCTACPGLEIFGTAALNPASAITANGQSQGYLAIFNNYTGGNLSLASLYLQAPGSPAVTLATPPVTISGVTSTGGILFNGGAWNAVAVDATEDAYVAGQYNIGPAAGAGQIYGQFVRFGPGGTPITNPVSTIPILGVSAGTPTTVATAVAVNPKDDTTYVVGWTTATLVSPAPASQLGILEPDITNPTGSSIVAEGQKPIGFNYTYPNTITNSGGADALFLTLKNNDLFVSPTSISFTSNLVPPGKAPGAQSFTAIGPPACTSAPTATVTLAGNFTVTLFSSVGNDFAFQVAPTAAALDEPGGSTANVVFSTNSGCPFDNPGASVGVSLTVNGAPIETLPSYSLVGLTTVQGTGVIQPFSNSGVQTSPLGSIADPVSLTTPATSPVTNITVAVASTSSNWPATCSLLSTSGGTSTATTLTITLNATCAATLGAGAYTASVTMTSPYGLVNPNCPNGADACLPFTLTVTAQTGFQPLSVVFGSSTFSQQTSFSVSAPASGGTFNYVAGYAPTSGTCPTLTLPIANVNPPLQAPVCSYPYVGSLLPAANVSIISGGSGSIAQGSSAVVTVIVSPTGLAAGVYSGEFLVSNCGSSTAGCTLTAGSTPYTIVPITVYVGAGLGLVSLSNQAGPFSISGVNPIDIEVFETSALPNPYTFAITGLDGTASQPYVLGAPVLSGASLPSGSVTVSPTTNCTTFGSLTSSALSGTGPACSYNMTVNASQFSQTYSITLTIPIVSGPSSGSLIIPITFSPNSRPWGPAEFQLNPLYYLDGFGTPIVPFPVTGTLTLNATSGQTTLACQELLAADNTGSGPLNVGLPYPTGVMFSPWESTPTPTYSPTGAYLTNEGTLSFTPEAFEICGNAQTPGLSVGLNQGVAFQFDASLPGGALTGGGAGVDLNISGTATTTPLNFSEIGVFRPVSAGGLGVFYVDKDPSDYNYPDAAVKAATKPYFFGLAGDTPVAGDWTGSGIIRLGVFRCPEIGQGTCNWYVDLNNNGQWDGVAGGDAVWSFGLPGDSPVVGDWNGSGVSKIGVMRCPIPAGVCTWYLDVSDSHAYVGSGASATAIYAYGLTGDLPAVGNWAGMTNAGLPVDNIGVFRCVTGGVCTWIVDSQGLNGYSPKDTTYSYGLAGDMPVTGNWLGTGSQTQKRIGVFRPSAGQWILNIEGTGVYAQGVDLISAFGLAGDQPVVGNWTLP